MHVVETHVEAGALGNEFLEIGALRRDAGGDDPREHHAEGAEQQQAKRDQQRASRPVRVAFVPPWIKGCFGHVTSSGQHHVVLVEAVERFHL